jgi:NTE family protein
VIRRAFNAVPAIAALATASLLACGHAGRGGDRPRTCLVLSVAGPKGFALVGAIEELRAQGHTFDCVYGNSMGALVGGLFASSPGADLAGRYGDFLGEVRREHALRERSRLARLDVRRWLALLFPGGERPRRVDLPTFERVLDAWLDGARIEALPVPFATSHLVIREGSPELVVTRSGSAARAIAGSVAHPGVFELGDAASLERLDPGVDRSARVPVRDACRVFGPARLVVLNVSGTPPYDADPACPATIVEVERGPERLTDLSSDPGARAELLRLGARSVRGRSVP